MILLNCKNISSGDRVVFLTHPLVPLDRDPETFLPEQIISLSKIGKIIAVDDPDGYYGTDHDRIIFYDAPPNSPLVPDHPYQRYIAAKIPSDNGAIEPAELTKIFPLIRDKQLYFAGGNLHCCLLRTILSVLPIISELKHSLVFILPKSDIWYCKSGIQAGYLSGENRPLARTYTFVEDIFPFAEVACSLESLIVSDLKKSIREDTQALLDRHGTNLFMHYNDQEHVLRDNPQNKLRVDLVLE